MANEFAVEQILTTPWGTITFNPTAGGNGYYIDQPISGLGQAPLRITVDDKPQAPGGIVHPPKRGARHLSVPGFILPIVGSAAVTLMKNLESALESIEGVDGTWAWTGSDSVAQILTVQGEIAVDFTDARPKRFLFGLVAADPTIS